MSAHHRHELDAFLAWVLRPDAWKHLTRETWAGCCVCVDLGFFVCCGGCCVHMYVSVRVLVLLTLFFSPGFTNAILGEIPENLLTSKFKNVTVDLRTRAFCSCREQGPPFAVSQA